MQNVTIFCVIVAAIITAVRLTLQYMEQKDRKNGVAVNPEEYKMSGLIRIMLRERFAPIIERRNAKREERRLKRAARKEVRKK